MTTIDSAQLTLQTACNLPTTFNRCNRIQPPTNRLQPPSPPYNRLHRLYSRIGFSTYLCLTSIPNLSKLPVIVRVQYFVRGGFVGHRSRASLKHLSSHLPVDELRFLGGQKGLRCSCKMHVWMSGPTKKPTRC
ncbi:hypothetical protein TNCV_3579701 [Trichonephila clavipes]|nr:hypothetical protein TNCV_3579701 [Trichonephila clavipes]